LHISAVSTDRQADEGFGLDVQEQAIRRWARDHGHRIVITSRDEGISGSHGADVRTGLHNALACVKDRTVDGLVVYRLDRLARKLTVQEAALAKVWDLGGTVFAVDLGEVPRDDPDDPVKTALRRPERSDRPDTTYGAQNLAQRVDTLSDCAHTVLRWSRGTGPASGARTLPDTQTTFSIYLALWAACRGLWHR
jgi:Resolvase, N terminal domain